MKAQVTIIDYGAGNLLNVQRAFEHQGASVAIATDADAILQANRLVFPGVGAFPQAMRRLQEMAILEAIKEAAVQKPFLGICLGMQMMLETSEEFSRTEGLGLIEGQVAALPNQSPDGENLRVPHIGWAPIFPQQVAWEQTLLSQVPENNAFYFVHSYYADPVNKEDQAAVFEFGGHKITAAIQRDNLFGCQFHPEKSGEQGLALIEAFLAI